MFGKLGGVGLSPRVEQGVCLLGTDVREDGRVLSLSRGGLRKLVHTPRLARIAGVERLPTG
jgi:hypothetical protein